MAEVEPEYMRTYREFWASCVETDGRLDLDKVARELHDYRGVLREVADAYSEVTGGVISKPNTAARHVVAYANRRADQVTLTELMDLLQEHAEATGDELRAAIAVRATELEQA